MKNQKLNKVATHPLQTSYWATFRKDWGNEILETDYGILTLHKIPATNYKLGPGERGEAIPAHGSPGGPITGSTRSTSRSTDTPPVERRPDVRLGSGGPPMERATGVAGCTEGRCRACRPLHKGELHHEYEAGCGRGRIETGKPMESAWTADAGIPLRASTAEAARRPPGPGCPVGEEVQETSGTPQSR